MKIEYDAVRDLLYVWFATPGTKAARTETLMPGVHADYDRDGRLIGIEVVDAEEVLGDKIQVEFSMTPLHTTQAP